LEKKSVMVLRDMARQFSVNTSNCVDKRDLIDALIASGKIEVVDGVPPIEYSKNDLSKMGVNELRNILVSFGLSTTGMIEKSELINRLIDSGRVVITSEMDHLQRGATDPSSPTPTTQPSRKSFSREHLSGLSVRELKNLMRENGVSFAGCVEKAEMIRALEISENVNVTET